ncbi:hypothetical protein Tco_1546189 [Tanacetum coccineum]
MGVKFHLRDREISKDLITEDDVSGAQDYYLCATISDPKDGEVMMQYATLVWELHRDIDKALTYQILNFEDLCLADCIIRRLRNHHKPWHEVILERHLREKDAG